MAEVSNFPGNDFSVQQYGPVTSLKTEGVPCLRARMQDVAERSSMLQEI